MAIDPNFSKLVQFCSFYSRDKEGMNNHEQLEDFVQPRANYNDKQISFSKNIQNLLGLKVSRFQSEQSRTREVAEFVRGYMDDVTAAHYCPEKYQNAYVNIKLHYVDRDQPGDISEDTAAGAEERLINKGTLLSHFIKGSLKIGQYFFLDGKLTKFHLDLVKVK